MSIIFTPLVKNLPSLKATSKFPLQLPFTLNTVRLITMDTYQKESKDQHNPQGAQGSGVDKQAPMSGYKTAKKEDSDDWVASAAGLPHAEGQKQSGSKTSSEDKGVGMGKGPSTKMGGADSQGRGSG